MPIRTLPDDLQKAAIEELNEVPERVYEDIEALRTWIKQQPHLKSRTDDQFLVNFLRGSKYSLEKAKSKIDKFYTFRTKYPEYFTGHNVDIDKLLTLFRLGVAVSLPTPLNENGPRIGFMRMGHYDPNKYTFVEINRASQLMQEISILEDDYSIVKGVTQIIDVGEVTTTHFLQMQPSIMKRMTVFVEEALPLRPKGAHFINTPSGFETMFNMFKPLMSEKQQRRLYLHGNKLDSLYAHIPQKYLPIEYGGENGSLIEITKQWEQRILGYRDYYAEENNYGTDESLRPGKPIDFENLFGLDGSFRKLNVD